MKTYSKTTPDKADVAIVIWLDATGGQFYQKEMTRYSVGWLLEDSDKRVVLATCWDREGWEDFTVIPQALVQKIERWPKD